MALLDDALKGWGTNILIGVGVVLVAPIILLPVAAAARPLAKALIKGYLALADAVKEIVEEVRKEGVGGVAEKVTEAVAEEVIVEAGEALIESAG